MTGIILRGVALGAAAVVLLLTGCSADPPPLPGAGTTTPSPSVTIPTVTPTPTPTAPTLPMAAQAGTEAGAEAFIRYFWDTYNYLYATGDATPLQQVMSDLCTFCEKAVTDVRSVRAAGHTFDGGEVTVESVAIPPMQSVTNLLANLLISQAELLVLDGARTVSRTAPTTSTALLAIVEHTNGSWRVIDVGVQ